MKKADVLIPIDGITINEKMKHLLDDGVIRIFKSKGEAVQFLIDNGDSEEDLRHIIIYHS